MTWEKLQNILFVVFIILAILLGTRIAVEDYIEKRNEKKPICDWCFNRIDDKKPTEISSAITEGPTFKIGERCWSELAWQYGWYEECSVYSMDRIYRAIRDRKL